MRFVPLLAMACSLAAANLEIDHVTVAGRNLAALRQALASIGIAAEYGGPHSNHATEMALASFADGSYLELIALQPNADPAAVAAHTWRGFLEHDAGPCAWALRVNNLAAETTRLAAAGISTAPPSRSGRRRPDGVRLDWETAQAGPGANGTFFPFMIRDLTPRNLRAFPNGKPTTNEFTGIAKVILAVKDLDRATGQYRRAYALPAPRVTTDAAFGARLASFEGAPIILAAPATPDNWLARRLERFGEAPCAFVLNKTGGDKITWFDESKLHWRLGWQ
jgi:hypothetical protein